MQDVDFRNFKTISTILIFILILLFLSPPFTGWIIDVLRLDVDIQQQSMACLYFIEAPSTNIIQDSEVNITVEISNCGSSFLEGRIAIEILNSSFDVVDSITSGNYSLYPSQYYIFNTTWIASPPLGHYWIYARDDNYNTNTTRAINQSFNITCVLHSYKCFGNELKVCVDPFRWEPVTVCSYKCENGTCIPEPGKVFIPEIGVPSVPWNPRIGLEYQKEINLSQNTKYTLIIKVINNGTVYLHNLRLDVYSEDIEADVPEIVVERLPTNSSIFFVFNIFVPGIPLGTYNIDFVVRARETSARGEIRVNVLSPVKYTDREKCRDMLSYYLDALESILQEIRILELKGYNVTELKKSLIEITQNIETAKKFEKSGLYSSCIDEMETIRRSLEKIVHTIHIIISKEEVKKPVIAQPFMPYHILYIVLAVMLTVAGLLVAVRLVREYWRRRRLMRIGLRW